MMWSWVQMEELQIRPVMRPILVDLHSGMWMIGVLVLLLLLRKLIIEGKVTLVDDDGKPLKKVTFSCDYDSEDEVASVDNDMALAKKDGYGTQSLLEQWTDSYENGDYKYYPYDDDMYECQDISKSISNASSPPVLNGSKERNQYIVFHISGCAIDNQVKFATCTLLGDALTWWNGHVRTLGHDAAYAMTWGTLKKKLTDKYCPKGEIKKLEIELWNLRVNKYISELPDNIHGNVMSTRPKTLDEAIELANDLMDHKLRTYPERKNDNKRKADDSSRNNQQPHKKQNVARAYTAGPSEKKAYTGNLPLCT
ncbi:reverse transcriptase domain-containing protein [Tanacetum coccineum]